MRCQMIGRPPISTIGLGRTAVSSPSRLPSPPAKITVFIRGKALELFPQGGGDAGIGPYRASFQATPSGPCFFLSDSAVLRRWAPRRPKRSRLALAGERDKAI